MFFEDVVEVENCIKGARLSVFGKPGVDVLAYTESTNKLALERIDELADGYIIMALEQTNGYGRYGRRWMAPIGGFWFSVVLKPEARAGDPLLGFALAVGAVMGLEAATGKSFYVKWPNDIMGKLGKVGGILVEVKKRAAVAGVGINVEVVPVRGASSVARELGFSPDPCPLLRSVLSRMEKLYLSWKERSKREIVEMWMSKCMHVNKEVEVIEGTRKFRGTFIGIDTDGSAKVRSKLGILRVQTGSIELVGEEASEFEGPSGELEI